MASRLQSARSQKSASRLPAIIAIVAAFIAALSLVTLLDTKIERQAVSDALPVSASTTKGHALLRPDQNSESTDVNLEVGKQVAEALRKAETEFKKLERSQSELIGTTKGEGSTGVHYLIRQPTQEEYEKYVAVLSRSMDGLSKEARQLAHGRQVKLIQEYTGFSSPFKIVQRWHYEIVNPDGTPGIRESSSETFVASRMSYELTRDGMNIWGRAGDGSGALRNFVGDEKDRYRHIFEEL